jgi:ABC-type nickel/cobalt efflux system permease component RcnA
MQAVHGQVCAPGTAGEQAACAVCTGAALAASNDLTCIAPLTFVRELDVRDACRLAEVAPLAVKHEREVVLSAGAGMCSAQTRRNHVTDRREGALEVRHTHTHTSPGLPHQDGHPEDGEQHQACHLQHPHQPARGGRVRASRSSALQRLVLPAVDGAAKQRHPAAATCALHPAHALTA